MRAAVHALASAALRGGVMPEHAGLAYDVYAPIGEGTERAAEFAPEIRDQWLGRIEEQPVPPDYTLAYDRWERSLFADGSVLAKGKLLARLLVGHGNPAPTEVGLTLHHTWGVPVVPGSALKGLLAHYVQTVYGPAAGDSGDAARAPYRGVRWDGPRVAAGPGEVFRTLFGAPPAADDEQTGGGETAGVIVFQDAWMVPQRTHIFARDIVTVHQRSYYTADPATRPWPNDYESPIPIAFLTVRPQVEFLFALSGHPDATAWLDWTMALLQRALAEWGVGGKTVAGYGRFAFNGSEQWVEARRREYDEARAPRVDPRERWRLLVRWREDQELLDWVRRVFEPGQGAPESPAALLPGLLGEMTLDPQEERAALRQALIDAGLPALWRKGETRRGRTQLGAAKLKQRARAVTEN